MMSQEAYIIWLWFLEHMCKMMTSQMLFLCFKSFDYRSCQGRGWGQRTENTQNYKKLCLSHFVSQEPYLIWLWFLVRMCKMMIFLAVFLIFFKIQIFWVLGKEGGVKGQKITHYYQFQSVTLYISRNVDHIIKIFGTQV